jgi:hypothetical protein
LKERKPTIPVLMEETSMPASDALQAHVPLAVAAWWTVAAAARRGDLARSVDAA